LAVGVSDNYQQWDTTHDLKLCDFGVTQYSARLGGLSAWRTAALAMAARGGYGLIFSFNVLNGGTQDKDGVYDCKDQGGVKGMSAPNCAMTATQIVAAAQALGDAGCGGLMMWTYKADRMALPAWQPAFTQVANLQARRAAKPCRVR
jgi:hypothetical protein